MRTLLIGLALAWTVMLTGAPSNCRAHGRCSVMACGGDFNCGLACFCEKQSDGRGVCRLR